MILVIDGNNLCHRANYALKDHLSYNRKSTSLLYGSMKMLNSLVNKFSPDNLVICWDSKNSLRADLNPTYKANRRVYKTKQELLVKNEFVRQLIEFRKVCNDIGIFTLEVDGLEGDDLMATVIDNSPDDFIILATSDNDLFQLLSNKVCIYNFKNIFTNDDFKEKYKISPEFWPEVKAIAGCKGDNVIGLRRVGEKTAIKILNGGRTTYSKNDLNNILEQNLQLVKLPFKDIKVEIQQTKINRQQLFSYQQQFSLKSIDNKRWLEIF